MTDLGSSATTEGSQTTLVLKSSAVVLSSTPIYPYACSQVETKTVTLNLKYCNQFDDKEEVVIANCVSNKLVGLNMTSAQSINIELQGAKDFGKFFRLEGKLTNAQ